MVICLLVTCVPTVAFASENTDKITILEKTPYYSKYTAIGDSICAGFTQLDYKYMNGFDILDNINNSPKFCYARLAGKIFGSTVYNLGNCGCDTDQLLDILTNVNNKYYKVYWEHIAESNLITLEIGSDDLIMAAIHSILKCIGGDLAEVSTLELLAMAEPLLTGDIPGIVNILEKTLNIRINSEQRAAILKALSDEPLRNTLEEAFHIYCSNFSQIVDIVRAVNPTAEFAILNYYNPNKGLNFEWGDVSYHLGDVIQKVTDQMNDFTRNFCEDNDYPYVDISNTLTNIIDPHPSTAGHIQIAAKLSKVLLNTVIVITQAGGTITPNGINAVKYRDNATFTITPKAGHEISNVTVDGKSVGAVDTYTFTDVRQSHYITAEFRIVEAYPY